MMKPFVCLWVGVLCLTACGGKKEKTREDYQKEYGPKLEARLANLAAANAFGKVARDSLGSPGDTKLTLTLEWLGPEAHPNTIVAHSEEIEDAKKAPISSDTKERFPTGPKLIFQRNSDNHVLMAKSVLGIVPNVSMYSEQKLKQLLEATYVLVVYPKDLTPANPNALGGAFKPGQAKAVAVLVEIETGTVHGGFLVDAESSEELTVNVRKSDGASDLADRVEYDLYAQTAKAIVEGVKARWPGASVPMLSAWGY